MLLSRQRAGLKCRAGSAATNAAVKIQLQKKVKFGESIKVVGSHPLLGGWNLDKAPGMTWSEGNVWTTEVALPEGAEVEFKLVKTGGSSAEWEGGNNRRLSPPADGTELNCQWGETGSSVRGGDGRRADVQEAAAAILAEGSWQEDDGSSSDVPNRVWQGRDIEFMSSNEHSNERRGKWDTSGLDGPALAFVQGDSKAGSWLQKLELAKRLLVDEAPRLRPGVDVLRHAFIYLQWVSTGALPCVEGGGHYRPNRHAELSRQIFRSLEWAIEEDRGAEHTVTLVARRLHTCLPSFSEEFTASVPLTLIRDIAHRGDIPHDLKQEIKHTLQNKLHRNAGPEDLVATEAMLERVTRNPGEYSSDFVHQFRIFTDQLRAFFSAASLTSILQAPEGGPPSIYPTLDSSEKQLVDIFLAAKRKLDAAKEPTSADLMDTMHSLTGVRALLVDRLRGGVRGAASDENMANRQRHRMGEIRCEEYFFVLLSRFCNQLEAKGGQSYLAASQDREWALPLGALVLGLRHLTLDYWQQRECAAVEAELGAWQRAGNMQLRENALRLKATLERLQRVAEGYTDALLELYPEPASALGHALGVPEHVPRVFTEAEVRASLVFQLSKLSTTLLKASRTVAGSGVWDAVVSGSAAGKLLPVERIDPVQLQALQEPVVLLVSEADGDEETAASAGNVRGVVLMQELPHLSHLGVRCRQERVVFATVEDRDFIAASVQPLAGKHVVLDVSAASVTLREATSGERAGGGGSSGGAAPAAVAAVAKPAAVAKVSKPVVLSTADCQPESCGAKAAACGRLERIAASSSGAAAFKTPLGCCLPFGSLELAIKEQAGAASFQQLLGATQTAELAGGQLDAVCEGLHNALQGTQLPGQLGKEIAAKFQPGVRVICRSSANVEDLAGLSGAGLYDSIPNVDPSSQGSLAGGVGGVWASLYTRRAVLSRRAAGVAQEDAAMAVLIQELLDPQYSFVLHTASPLDPLDKGTAVVELAAGLGETLASAKRGSPWRLSIDKASGKVTILAFANLSEAMLPQRSVATAPGSPEVPPSFEPVIQMMDYSQQELSWNEDLRAELGRRIGAISLLLEEEFGGPQDVEGCLVGKDIYIVQARPQP